MIGQWPPNDGAPNHLTHGTLMVSMYVYMRGNVKFVWSFVIVMYRLVAIRRLVIWQSGYCQLT